jgi:PAS domain S-box-containing protein
MNAHPTESAPSPTTAWFRLALGLLLIPIVLYGAYSESPSLAHDLAEMFSVIVACGIFMLTWNARNLIDNHYVVFLGIAYLFVGGLDYLHGVSFSGNLTPRYHNVSIEFWFASRYLQSLALLAAPLFAVRKIRPVAALSVLSAVALALFGAVYHGFFPDFYVPGKGLTPAKSVSDGIVAGIQALSIVALWAVRDRFDRDVFRLFVLSVLFSIATEMSAFVHADAFVYNSVAGHSLKVASFFLVYKAVIQTGLVRPYALLFRNLQATASEIRTARDLLEAQVAARTEELRAANRRLEEELAERRRAAAMRELMLDLHHVTQPADKVRDLLSALPAFLQARFGFEAVGIRYRQDADYPYIAPRGFPSEFVQGELSLCSPAEGDPPYECTCGAVIGKRFDSTLPFFTPGGTFWTNGASELHAASGAYRALATRGRCVRQGYESIALVPLRLGGVTFGLLQLNDRRKGLCTPHFLEQVERVAENLSGVLARLVAQDALRDSEDRFRSLVENSSIAILICQRNRILYENPRVERMFGEHSADTPFRELGAVHPEDAGKFERLCEEMERPVPGPQDVDIRFLAEDPEREHEDVRWIRCQATPIAFRERASLLVELTDVTRIRELENIVTVRDKLAALGQMAAGIAHEIRNPLSGININVSSVDLLCRRAEGLDPEEKERIRHAVAQARAASERISRVIQRVMDFAKPSLPKRSRIDLNRVVRDALALSAVSARKSGIELRERLSPEPLYCHADPALLEQVLLNLVTNAFQAMESSDRPGHLTVTAATEGGRVVLRVADTGAGVPAHLREKIFEPFYTTRKDGYGIGLSFSHRIVSDHGGRLSVGAAEGGGAEFRVELPLTEEGSRP